MNTQRLHLHTCLGFSLILHKFTLSKSKLNGGSELHPEFKRCQSIWHLPRFHGNVKGQRLLVFMQQHSHCWNVPGAVCVWVGDVKYQPGHRHTAGHLLCLLHTKPRKWPVTHRCCMYRNVNMAAWFVCIASILDNSCCTLINILNQDSW